MFLSKKKKFKTILCLSAREFLLPLIKGTCFVNAKKKMKHRNKYENFSEMFAKLTKDNFWDNTALHRCYNSKSYPYDSQSVTIFVDNAYNNTRVEMNLFPPDP